MAFNALCALLLIAAAAGLTVYLGPGPATSQVVGLAAFEFTFFTIIECIILLFHATIGRLIPSLRQSGGAIVVFFSAVPWLMLLYLPIMPIIDRLI